MKGNNTDELKGEGGGIVPGFIKGPADQDCKGR